MNAPVPDIPTTPDYKLELRNAFKEQLMETDPSPDSPYMLLTRQHAQQIIGQDKQRVTGPFDCWEGDFRSNERYVKKNLRNTKSQVPGRTTYNINHQFYMHHIALIADGRLAELERAHRKSGNDVSHLCHNTRCFNPKHLVVESSTLNIVSSDICPTPDLTLYRLATPVKINTS